MESFITSGSGLGLHCLIRDVQNNDALLVLILHVQVNNFSVMPWVHPLTIASSSKLLGGRYLFVLMLYVTVNNFSVISGCFLLSS